MVAWARKTCPDVNGKAETAAFVDHFLAASGSNAIKRDWVAAWRNWLRREQKRIAERRSNSSRASLNGAAHQTTIPTRQEWMHRT
jgi:hypothetical protein